MTTFSAIFLSKTAIGLRHRTPLIPCVKRRSGVPCSRSKGRDYSTSFPVRYIPKKLSKPEESVASSFTTKRFEGIEKHKPLEQNVERRECFEGIEKHKALEQNVERRGRFQGNEKHRPFEKNVVRREPFQGEKHKALEQNTERREHFEGIGEHKPFEHNVERKERFEGGEEHKSLEQTVERRERFQDIKNRKALEQNVEKTKFYRDRKGPSMNFLFDDRELLGSVNPSVELEIGSGIWAEDELEEPVELEQEFECNLDQYSKQGNQVEAGGDKEDVKKLAIQLLSTRHSRAFTAVELRKKLQGKKFPLNVVDEVIGDFEDRGFINDRLYAETFSVSRWSSSCWGPKRIKQALHEKGVSKVDAEKALNVIFKNGENDEDHEAVLGMSKLSIDHLLVQASKQWLRSNGVDREKRKSRLIRWLQYRGFSWGVISFVLKKLQAEYPP